MSIRIWYEKECLNVGQDKKFVQRVNTFNNKNIKEIIIKKIENNKIDGF